MNRTAGDSGAGAESVAVPQVEDLQQGEQGFSPAGGNDIERHEDDVLVTAIGSEPGVIVEGCHATSVS